MDFMVNDKTIKEKARKIKLVLTDNDGVLTDTGVYYSDKGEEFKKYSIRDGMGVERLRNLVQVKTGIITGEVSGPVKKRAEKLKIEDVLLGIKEKDKELKNILQKYNYSPENIAFIGDDVNDLSLMKIVGFTAAPADAIDEIKEITDYVCKNIGGHGAFREFAELIIYHKLKKQED